MEENFLISKRFWRMSKNEFEVVNFTCKRTEITTNFLLNLEIALFFDHFETSFSILILLYAKAFDDF